MYIAIGLEAIASNEFNFVVCFSFAGDLRLDRWSQEMQEVRNDTSLPRQEILFQ